MELIPGHSGSGRGGDVHLRAGAAVGLLGGRGGNVSVTSGASLSGTSGDVIISSPNSGSGGQSGRVALMTGNSLNGSSGAVGISTGKPALLYAMQSLLGQGVEALELAEASYLMQGMLWPPFHVVVRSSFVAEMAWMAAEAIFV